MHTMHNLNIPCNGVWVAATIILLISAIIMIQSYTVLVVKSKQAY